jgi:hypothetical protein
LKRKEAVMKKILVSIICGMLLLTMTACGSNVEVEVPETNVDFNTPGANPLVGEAAENGRVADIGQGLWHGVIAPVTLFISFFNEDIQMYEVHNNGRQYNLGFLLGVAIIFLLLGFTGRGWR